MEYPDEYFFFTFGPAFPLWRREAGECKQVGDDSRYISTFFHLPPMGHSMGHRHKHIFCAITELLMHHKKTYILRYCSFITAHYGKRQSKMYIAYL